MHHLFVTLILMCFCGFSMMSATDYTFNECRGSSMPYIDPVGSISVPDSLRVVMINHVGRHGARFMASGKKANAVKALLLSAQKKRTITLRGKKLLALTEKIINESNGRWGALDTLGKAEQRWLAARMGGAFSKILSKNSEVNAISSYVPRCVMSMYSFTHQLVRQNNKLEIYTSSGRQNNNLMRFFDGNKEFKDFENSDLVRNTVMAYADTMLNNRMLTQFIGSAYPLDSVDVYEGLMNIYSVLAGTAAIEMKCDIGQYFTKSEFNNLWAVANLKQYLTHSASSLSEVPAQIAAPLLENLIATTDSFISGADRTPVQLRFGHAETLMPLLALMHIPGCRYITDNLAEVAYNWRNFEIVPMAANFRLVLFRASSGRYYVRADLNEKPVELIPERPVYVPWEDAKAYLCLRAGIN